MLDTLIEIGRIFRENNRLEKHRYVKQGYEPEKDKETIYYSIPVDEGMNIQINDINEIPENKREKLFYLNFKTSDADSLKKYIFGDIYRYTKKNKDETNYKFGDPTVKAAAFTVSSFFRAEEDAKYFQGTKIEAFRKSFATQIEEIEKKIKSQEKIFLHFDFSGYHWYELQQEMEQINQKIIESFIQFDKNTNGYVLEKFLYKTLIGRKSVTPGFDEEAKFKSKFFKTIDEVFDLIYSIDSSTIPILNRNNIKIIALPRAKNLSVEQIEGFFSQKGLQKHKESIEAINYKDNDENSIDNLFAPLVLNELNTDSQFDVIFSKTSASPSAPDVDLIEINRIRKSVLIELHERIKNVKTNLVKKHKNIENKISAKLFDAVLQKINKLQILSAFSEILGDLTKDKKKYQSHLLKTLPKIYTGNYLEDPVLLPAFIEKCQFNIRNAETGFIFLKHDYIFLTLIRNNKKGEEEMKKMEESNSYAIGHSLGEMAKPLRSKIASFEKNYVGLLSRRIADLNSFLQFFNYISEKLAIHNALYPSLKEKAMGITEKVKKMESKDYAKNYVSFGFFEGYFSPFEQKTEDSENVED